MANFNTRTVADSNAVAKAAAEAIVALAKECVAKKGSFSLALSGGSTPKTAYALMASEPLVSQMPWKQTQLYFGDERHVRPDHPDSNYRMAHESMLKTAPLPAENVFPIATDDADVVDAAKRFEKLLHGNFPNVKPGEFPSIDLMLLGIGPDGHTASLFPGTPAPKEMSNWVTWCDPNSANPAIKPPVKRVTMTTPVIWSAANVFVLATGAEKKPMLAKIFSESEPADAPVSRLLRKCKGQVTFFLDQAAS